MSGQGNPGPNEKRSSADGIRRHVIKVLSQLSPASRTGSATEDSSSDPSTQIDGEKRPPDGIDDL